MSISPQFPISHREAIKNEEVLVACFARACLTYLNPLRYFLLIIRGIFLKGNGFDILWPQMLALALLGAVVFTYSSLRFSKRLE